MAVKLDAPRKLIVDTIGKRPDLDLKKVSLKADLNHAYLQQFIYRGVPANLPESVREAVGKILSIPPDALKGKGKARAGRQTQVDQTPDQPPVIGDASSVRVPEFDVRAAMGPGGSLIEIDDATASDAVVGEYSFPRDGFRQLYGAPPDAVRIISVVGDSMTPTLFPGQKVMVDLTDRRPSPPGIFVVYDGLGLVLKRVEVVFGSDPPRVRISSDNQNHAPYERTLDEAHINGRVIGVWARL
ncbi:S24 family peptidase [Vineibacter terrae]|uniref:S24 family peptidase n=1 Tax=Vineibacter terrae TaxID=2586908 RepID=A0A5C8P9C3_9HYPH|nr:S24 family peptidase [Vineibacter terrae]TXL70129.1 S24 family peptidase [Vineibacter terrae]